MAECIRTFQSCVIDGRQWMNRLETLLTCQEMKNSNITTYVPPTRRPNIRTARSKVNEFDAYGFRPMEHPWRLLSAYEFLQQWKCEPLLVPTHYTNRSEAPRTTWTQQGAQLLKSQAYKDGEIAAKPGEHFVALPAKHNDYHTFPAAAGAFAHSWALVRKRRPQVVVIEGLPLPSVNKSAEYNAQYFSLFFRPWTLHAGDATVPHLSLLGMEKRVLNQWHQSMLQPSQVQASKRLKTKQLPLKSSQLRTCCLGKRVE